MFIELSDGSVVNTDHVSFVRKDTDPYEFKVFSHPRYFVAFSGIPTALMYNEEDANKIKAAILDMSDVSTLKETGMSFQPDELLK